MISTKQIQITKQGLEQYKLCKSWPQLRQWHRRHTPSIDDETFRLYMKSYAGDAWMLKKSGNLLASHQFMLYETPTQQKEQKQDHISSEN